MNTYMFGGVKAEVNSPYPGRALERGTRHLGTCQHGGVAQEGS